MRLRWLYSTAQQLLRSHPYKVNIATSALVFSVGDALCQVVERNVHVEAADHTSQQIPTSHNQQPEATIETGTEETAKTARTLDVPRVLRATAFGTGISVWLQWWWGFLQNSAERLVPVARYRKIYNVLFVVAADQAIGASILNAGYFFSVTWLENFDFQQALSRVQQCWLPQMLAHWSFWPWFQIVLFYAVAATSSRLLIRNIVFAAWSGTMSYRNHVADTVAKAV